MHGVTFTERGLSATVPRSMGSDTRKPRIDEDGVRFSSRRGRGAASARALGVILVTSALAVVGLSVAAVWWLRRDPGARVAVAVTESIPEPAERVAAHAVRPGGARAVAADVAAPEHPDQPERSAKPLRRAPAAPAAPAVAPAAGQAAVDRKPAAATDADAAATKAAEQENRHIEKIAQDVIAGMRAAGETKGLAAFPPPGTNPVKPGLLVPNDFQLPEGYIRHYQTTDDGKRLEPILMFSPDYEFVDDAGNPIVVPADGIVPPGMAPKGMPLRSLDVPGAGHPKPKASGDGR